ncbi:unnamed protein product, partial [Mesorhabditis spiculigera]
MLRVLALALLCGVASAHIAGIRSEALKGQEPTKEKIVAANGCPDGWDAYFDTDTCVQAFTAKLDYFNAEMSCNQENGHLVSIHNGFQNAQVLAAAQTSFTQCRYWVGANRFGSTNSLAGRADQWTSWSWVDKTEWNYASWKPGFPDNGTSAPDCAFMDVESGNARWANNGSCAEKNCYVCQKPKNGMTTMAPMTTGTWMPTMTPPPYTNPTTPYWYTTQYPWNTTPNGRTTWAPWGTTPNPWMTTSYVPWFSTNNPWAYTTSTAAPQTGDTGYWDWTTLPPCPTTTTDYPWWTTPFPKNSKQAEQMNTPMPCNPAIPNSNRQKSLKRLSQLLRGRKH